MRRPIAQNEHLKYMISVCNMKGYFSILTYRIFPKMSAKTNPRPEFMSRLTALCRNLDSEVKTLELEARGALLQTKVRQDSPWQPPDSH